MNIVAAIQQAQDRAALKPAFAEKVEIVTCLLRAKQVLPKSPISRSGIEGVRRQCALRSTPK